MTGFNNNNNNNFRSKPKGIHHANIKDKDKAVKRLKSSFRKTSLKMTLENDKREIIAAVVLSEIHPKSAYVFVEENLKKGTTLLVHLKEPLAIDVRGRIRYCELADRNSSTSKPDEKHNYRALIEFLINSDSERDAMLDYYQQVRDENYVATKWHHYISEKAQQEAKARLQQRKMAEKVEEVKEQPVLATDDMLVQATTDAMKKNSPDGNNNGGSGGHQNAA